MCQAERLRQDGAAADGAVRGAGRQHERAVAGRIGGGQLRGLRVARRAAVSPGGRGELRRIQPSRRHGGRRKLK